MEVLEQELEKFMIWYKNNIPIGTNMSSKEIVKMYLGTK